MKRKAVIKGIYVPSEEVAVREIQGEFVIIPITSGIGENEDDIFMLSETARAIWNKLDGNRSLKNVADLLRTEFDVSDSKIQEDVLGLAEELLKRKMLVHAKK